MSFCSPFLPFTKTKIDDLLLLSPVNSFCILYVTRLSLHRSALHAKALTAHPPTIPPVINATHMGFSLRSLLMPSSAAAALHAHHSAPRHSMTFPLDSLRFICTARIPLPRRGPCVCDSCAARLHHGSASCWADAPFPMRASLNFARPSNPLRAATHALFFASR